MNRIKLEDLNVNGLVTRFTAIAVEQDDSIFADDNARYNRLYRQMEDVEGALKAQKNDERRALLPLYDHPNAQVRLKAAIATLAIAPQAARRVLQIIIDGEEYPQAADARGMLRVLDDGTFKPT